MPNISSVLERAVDMMKIERVISYIKLIISTPPEWLCGWMYMLIVLFYFPELTQQLLTADTHVRIPLRNCFGTKTAVSALL